MPSGANFRQVAGVADDGFLFEIADNTVCGFRREQIQEKIEIKEYRLRCHLCEHGTQRQLDAAFFADGGHEAHRHQGMAPEGEEAVCYGDA